MGNVVEYVDKSRLEKSADDVRKYMEEEKHWEENLANSTSFQLVWAARKYDDWFLDPIVGFIIPGVGDLLSSIATFPAVYVAAVKIRSLRLTVAILTTIITDFLVGCLPVAGDIVDAFYKSSKIASRLIVGYVEDDKDTKAEINRRATWGVIGVVITGGIIWLLYSVIMSLYEWIVGLF